MNRITGTKEWASSNFNIIEDAFTTVPIVMPVAWKSDSKSMRT